MITATAGVEANPIRVIRRSKFGLPVVTLEGEDAAVRGDAMLAGVALLGLMLTLLASDRAKQ